MNLLVKQIRKKILPILHRHGIEKAGLFGSIVRDELKEESDIDILIEIKKDISLLDFIGIKLELEDELGTKIDLVEYDTIKPRLKDRILKEQVRII